MHWMLSPKSVPSSIWSGHWTNWDSNVRRKEFPFEFQVMMIWVYSSSFCPWLKHLSTTILLILMTNCKNHSEHDDFDFWLFIDVCLWLTIFLIDTPHHVVWCSDTTSDTISDQKMTQKWLIIDKFNFVYFMIIVWLISFISLKKLKNGIFDYFSNEMQFFFTNKLIFFWSSPGLIIRISPL